MNDLMHARRVIPWLTYCGVKLERQEDRRWSTPWVSGVTCPDCRALIVAEVPLRAAYLPPEVGE
jgi:hypothetical protein